MEVIIFILYSYRILVDIPVGKLSLLDQERHRIMELKLSNFVVRLWFMVYGFCLVRSVFTNPRFPRTSLATPRAVVE